MPFEPDSDPCNIDDMCRIGEQTCHTIPKEICDQHYFIRASAPGTTGVVKCTLNGDKTSCVNGATCDPVDQNWVNLQPRYSFNTEGPQGSTNTDNTNNICSSFSLPADTCENGIDGYYYDFSGEASPTSECEWRNYHGWWSREFSTIPIPLNVEERNQLSCSDDNLKDPAYLFFQGFTVPRSPPTLKARCNPLPPTPISSSNSNTEKKNKYHNPFDGSIDISPLSILGIIFLFFVIISIIGLLS